MIELSLTPEQIESIPIDYGIIYTNYGESDQALLAPSRGGGDFTVAKSIRDIEYDGKVGKMKGMQIVEEINAQLNVTILDASMKRLSLAMPFAKLEGDGSTTPYSLTCDASCLGVIPDSAYLKNIVMFCKTIKGKYKKITLHNPLNEGDFNLKAAPKGEGEIGLEIHAHWDSKDDTSILFKIEDVDDIS